MEVGGLGDAVRFGQGQASRGLFQVDATTDTGLDPFFDLKVDLVVLLVIFFGQIKQAPVAQNVQIGAYRLERYVFRRVHQVVPGGALKMAELFNPVTGRAAVEEQLGQFKGCLAWRVVRTAGVRVVGFPSNAAREVDARQPTTPGTVCLLSGGEKSVVLGENFRVGRNRLTHRLIQVGGGKAGGGEKDKEKKGNSDQNRPADWSQVWNQGFLARHKIGNFDSRNFNIFS